MHFKSPYPRLDLRFESACYCTSGLALHVVATADNECKNVLQMAVTLCLIGEKVCRGEKANEV